MRTSWNQDITGLKMPKDVILVSEEKSRKGQMAFWLTAISVLLLPVWLGEYSPKIEEFRTRS